MELHNLFPTPIGFFDLQRPLTDLERAFLTEQPQRPNMGNTSSDNKHVLDDACMFTFRQWIEASVAEYLAAVYVPKNEVRLRITQSWTNNTEAGHFHHKHEHPNSVVSGVFYIQTDPKTDKIFFYKNGYQQITLPPKDYNNYNSTSWWFEAIPNRLVLFPSSLTHMVPTLEAGSKTRISMSFNTFPVGIVGDEMELTELVL